MRVIFILLIFNFAACLYPESFYSKDYYEKISSMKVPSKAVILESIDNGEFVTATTFSVDEGELIKFAKFYGFVSCKSDEALKLYSLSYLEGNKPDIEHQKNYLCKNGSKGSTGYLYVIDLEMGILWAEIRYGTPGTF